jgi:hypothetical protein
MSSVPAQAGSAEGTDFPRIHFPGAFLAIGCQCHSLSAPFPVNNAIVSFIPFQGKGNKNSDMLHSVRTKNRNSYLFVIANYGKK